MAIIRKYSFHQKSVILFTVFLLTFSRTVYVGAVDSLTAIPGLRLISGLIMIGLALRLVLFTDFGLKRSRPLSWIRSWIKMSFVLLFTDFTICLDNVIVTAELSSHPITAAFGIFISLMTAFVLLRLLPESVAESGWIQIIAAGLISHIAFLGIVKDPLLADKLIRLDQMLKGTDISKAIQIIAVNIAIIMIIIGILKKNQTKGLSRLAVITDSFYAITLRSRSNELLRLKFLKRTNPFQFL